MIHPLKRDCRIRDSHGRFLPTHFGDDREMADLAHETMSTQSAPHTHTRTPTHKSIQTTITDSHSRKNDGGGAKGSLTQFQ